MKKTLSSQTFRMAVLALEKMRIDASSILTEIGISRGTLANPLARIAVEKELRFWGAVVRKAGDSRVVLRMAENVPLGSFPLLEYIGSSSWSLYQALALFSKYAGIVHGCWHPKLTETAAQVRFVLGAEGLAEEFRYTNEFALATLVDRLKHFTGGDIPLTRVHFRHASTGSLREYERVFGARVLFGQPADGLFFSQTIKEIPCRNRDNFLLGALLKVAENISSSLPGGAGSARRDSELLSRVKDAVKRRLLDGAPALRSVAGELAMSSRSLQRKLELEGWSMNGVVAAVRKESASGMLRAGAFSNEEIALMLGYSTLSAFDRAFKQWFKVTPSQYRSSGAADLSRIAPGK
ncbi:MAG: AraC family transcriptional regulator [Elusimicrobiota bacterium]